MNHPNGPTSHTSNGDTPSSCSGNESDNGNIKDINVNVSSSSSGSVAASPVFSTCVASLYGGLIGDAAGAMLEFHGRPVTLADVDEAMLLPGREAKLCSNYHRLGKGQLTDDGELTLCVLEAGFAFCLSWKERQLRSRWKLDWTVELVEEIARLYKRWYESEPFAVGSTTVKAFTAVRTATRPTFREAFTAQAAELNSTSQANGSLMRCSPLAILLGPSPSLDQVHRLVKTECALSHPSMACQIAQFYYVLALNHLLFHPRDADGAIALVESHARSRLMVRDADSASFNDGESAVLDWLLQDSIDASQLDCAQEEGWVRWAFTLAFYHLRRKTEYKSGIVDTILRGGDTDTNALIVGTFIGALHGLDNIPSVAIQTILKAEEPRRGQRPDFVTPNASRIDRAIKCILETVTSSSS